MCCGKEKKSESELKEEQKAKEKNLDAESMSVEADEEEEDPDALQTHQVCELCRDHCHSFKKPKYTCTMYVAFCCHFHKNGTGFLLDMLVCQKIRELYRGMSHDI